jgi:hypothetical protein
VKPEPGDHSVDIEQLRSFLACSDRGHRRARSRIEFFEPFAPRIAIEHHLATGIPIRMVAARHASQCNRRPAEGTTTALRSVAGDRDGDDRQHHDRWRDETDQYP